MCDCSDTAMRDIQRECCALRGILTFGKAVPAQGCGRIADLITWKHLYLLDSNVSPNVFFFLLIFAIGRREAKDNV